MNDESRTNAAPGNPAATAGYVAKATVTAWCRGVIEDTIAPHTLPVPLADLWRDGFMSGALAVKATADREIARLQDDVNHWYVSANYSPAEIAEMRRKASYLQQNINWDTGVVA